MQKFAIQFEPDPNEPRMYAALLGEGLGFTADKNNALIFDSTNAALKMLKNGYGSAMRECATILILCATERSSNHSPEEDL